MNYASLPMDELITQAELLLSYYDGPTSLASEKGDLENLKNRLFRGEMHIALIGQFNRGKSTFLNTLMGEDLLPVSVLPLTSLSTEIRYGTTPGFRIRFTQGREIYHREYTGSISDALVPYVAEQENPKNHKNVTSVEVFYPHPLLHHGTVFIDTPGFGSTHIHNTRATISLLKECDAALFMLSADLPVTQMELNFLKTIQPHVTQLFFIYNKIDLLTEPERRETTAFILHTLQEKLTLAAPHLFQISTKDTPEYLHKRDALTAKIQEFIQREKYFSLAQALTNKLHDLCMAAAQKVSADIRAHAATCEEAAHKQEEVRRRIQQKKQEREETRAFLYREEKRVRHELHHMAELRSDQLITRVAELLYAHVHLEKTPLSRAMPQLFSVLALVAQETTHHLQGLLTREQLLVSTKTHHACTSSSFELPLISPQAALEKLPHTFEPVRLPLWNRQEARKKIILRRAKEVSLMLRKELIEQTETGLATLFSHFHSHLMSSDTDEDSCHISSIPPIPPQWHAVVDHLHALAERRNCATQHPYS